MTDKKDLIRIMEVYEDNTGTYEIGDVDWSIVMNNLDKHLKKYGKKAYLKRWRKLKKDMSELINIFEKI